MGQGTIATKRDPQLWEKSKREACGAAGLCKHSARKMQWATRYYKSHGGRYGESRRADNSMSRWTKQRWRTASGRPSRGKRRYLPAEAWRHLTPAEIRRTNKAKLSGSTKGHQWVRQPRDIARKTSKFRA